MIQTQNRNQQDDHGFVHVGRTLNYAAREISCALDAYISTRVSAQELEAIQGTLHKLIENAKAIRGKN